jgi:hypothetical protein
MDVLFLTATVQLGDKNKGSFVVVIAQISLLVPTIFEPHKLEVHNPLFLLSVATPSWQR